MYKIEYLETAKKEIDDIVYYISFKLNNPTAALKLLEKFEKADKIF